MATAAEDVDLYGDLSLIPSAEGEASDSAGHCPTREEDEIDKGVAGVFEDTPVQHAINAPECTPVATEGPFALLVGNMAWWTSDAALQGICEAYGKLRQLPHITCDPVLDILLSHAPETPIVTVAVGTPLLAEEWQIQRVWAGGVRGAFSSSRRT